MLFPRVFLTLGLAALASAQTPRILYSDMDSGPKTGGENNLGVYVTVYGANFGSSRGSSTVTIGGGSAANYPIWTNNKITFQLGPVAASGEIRVVTGAGTSNGVPFTVRAGSIYFVSTNGSDAAAGGFSAPWRTIQKGVNTMAPGDTVYVMNGVVEARPGSSDGSVTLYYNNGAPGQPKAIIGYPGALATIGALGSGPCGTSSCTEGLKATYPSSYWTIANLRLLGNNYGIALKGTDYRVIGNEFTCPQGNGQTACLEGTQSLRVKVYGNNVHDVGFAGASGLYHGIYFSTDTSYLDIGWNSVTNIKGCRGIQIHSSRADASSGLNQFAIDIHDNYIRDTQCDGIVLATIDPSRGAVRVFNNVIVNGGRGPITPELGGHFACVYVAGTTNNGPEGAGTVDIYNNTLVNCGSSVPFGNGGVAFARRNTTLDVRLRNNIFYHTNGTPYILAYDAPGSITGSNNLFFGNGPAPAEVSGLFSSLSGDPRFANPSSDFHILAGSAARGTGVDAGLVTDIEGTLRGASSDIGAYAGSGASSPLPIANPSFLLSANPPSVTLASGSSAVVTTISLSPLNGFAGMAGLTCTPAIPGISCFNASAGPGAPGTLSLSFPGLAAGTYVVNVRGQAGSVTASTPFTIVILPPPGGGFGGGGTGGLGGGPSTGSTPSAPPAGVQSIVFRNGSGWARTFGFVELTDFRFELRLHGLDAQPSGLGTIFQTDSNQVGGLAISSLGFGVRLQVIGLADDNPSAPSCTLDLNSQQAADVVIRYQRAADQLSLRAYDYTGTVELANSTGNCAVKFGTVGGITALSVGADPFGNRRGAFNLAWLRLFRTSSAAAPGVIGTFNPALDFEFEGSLLNTPSSLGPGLSWQTGDQPEFGATPSYVTVGSFVPVANSSFDLSATAVAVSASTPTATSTISIVPRPGLAYSLQADVTCVNPPAGITCGVAYPSLQTAAPLSINIGPTVQPGSYTITLLGRAANAQGSGALNITILPAAGGNSLAGNFGSRSLVISQQTGWAAGENPSSPLNLGDFRLEMRLHALEAVDGTIVRALSTSGEPLGTLAVAREGDRLEIRAVELPGDFGGTYNCSIQLTTSQASDLVLRFQRSGRNYSLRTWDSTGLRENAAPASAPFCLLAQSTSAQFSGISVGGLRSAASFQIAWLRLYGVATPAAPGGLPAPGALVTYEFENTLFNNAGVALDWNGIQPQFVPTPQ